MKIVARRESANRRALPRAGRKLVIARDARCREPGKGNGNIQKNPPGMAFFASRTFTPMYGAGNAGISRLKKPNHPENREYRKRTSGKPSGVYTINCRSMVVSREVSMMMGLILFMNLLRVRMITGLLM